MMTRRLLAALVLATAMALVAGPVYAHGFGERYDLPIPLDYFLVGAAGAVALSFVVVGLFVRRRLGPFDYPRLDLLALPWLGRALRCPLLLTPIRLLSAAAFGLIVAAALIGTNSPIENLAPTAVWILWWVGMGYLSALLGNVWMLINPWKIAFEWAQALTGVPAKTRDRGRFAYPEGLDVWPAVLIFLLFAWLENVYPDAAQPQKLGVLVVLYSLVTWAGMAAFGKHEWLRGGEAFSVLFGLFARFSPTEVRSTDTDRCAPCGGCAAAGPSTDSGRTLRMGSGRPAGGENCVDCYECFEAAGPGGRQLNLRPYAVGLIQPARMTTAMALFVMLALATVTFDGLTETSAWVDVQTAVWPAAELAGAHAVQAIDTAGLLLLPALFVAVYLGFSWAVRRLSGEPAPIADVAKGFVLSLVPIALAYNLAHFISFLLIQGQLIIPLASDPFGFGWDLFGAAGYRLNIGVIDARTAWFISVAAIVAGHIVSVYVAHETALKRVADRARALRGQYPMLALMVLYTATSLWIIAQPIVSDPS